MLRTLLSATLALATLACATLAVLGGLLLSGVDLPLIQAAPGNQVAAPAVVPGPAPDNPRPPRNLTKMVPDQFDVVTSRKDLIGTSIRHIVVQPDRVRVMVGPQSVWSGTFASIKDFDGRISLGDVGRLIARSPFPDTLRETSPGVYLLRAGLAQSPGTRLEFVSPEVTELRMASAPYVYVVGVGAQALFNETKVTSWLPEENRPDDNPFHRRPFVSYDEGGRLDIINSEMAYLGSDSSKAYGVSWGEATTGEATRSVFHHNLFGLYTSKAVNVTFRQNTARDNAIYGFDPHTSSTGLTVIDNDAYGNNSHGIIFSENVRDSVIEGNRSFHNGGNGIMMDERSDANQIRDNEVFANRGDGVVIQGSSGVLVTGNQVSGNRVGIRVNANELGPTQDTRIETNRLDRNQIGIEVYGGARGTTSQGNEIRDSADQAIVLTEPTISVSDLVAGARKALVVTQTEVGAQGLRVADVETGVLVSGPGRVNLAGPRIDARDVAVDVEPGGHVTITGDGPPAMLSGARKGLSVEGTAELRNVSIFDVGRGVLVGVAGRARIEATEIVASSKGLEIFGPQTQDRVELLSSDVRAAEPVVAPAEPAVPTWPLMGNEVDPVPSWLALAGGAFLALALALHLGSRVASPAESSRHKALPVQVGGSGGSAG
ncbi:MAG: right-handed parallel beta-helix repeat-containing protein [Pseudonocardia sp.]